MRSVNLLYVTLIALAVSFLQCRTLRVNKKGSQRTVEIISGGANAAYGHHVLRIRETSVEIDTSYYLSECELYATIDTIHFYEHLNKFNTDMIVPLNRLIYEKLLRLPMDTLLRYERQTQNDGHGGYSFQEITIIDKGETHKLNYRLHIDRAWLPGSTQGFLLELEEMFPFRVGAWKPAVEYYR